MSVLRLVGFTGEIPRLLPRLLPEAAAQQSFNTRLTDGGLTPIRQSLEAFVFPNPPADDDTIYRHKGEWLTWPGFVKVVPGPVADDRLYITGHGVPKMFVAGEIFQLAVTAPINAVTATVSGEAQESATARTRLYVYTWVTRFGEESQPSPVSADVIWRAGQTVTLSGFSSPPSGRGVDRMRLYRSQSGASGGNSLFFIDERAATTADYVDTIAPEDIQEVLPSSGWNEPVDDLQGIVSLPNGMMAAFAGKDLYFCEPYRPHVWPDAYSLATDYDIVALGAFGNSLLVATAGNPYLVSGSAPESMIMEKLELNLPCTNPRGMVDLGYSVAYPSHDGLVIASSAGVRVATSSLFARHDWQRLNPETFAAGQFNGRYFASYTYRTERDELRAGTIILDITGEQPFIIRTDVETGSFFYDIQTGQLFYLSQGRVMEWDSERMPNTVQAWRSKEFYAPKPANFGAILIDARETLTRAERDALDRNVTAVAMANREAYWNDHGVGALGGRAVNAFAVNGNAIKVLPQGSRTVTVNVYADGVLRATVNRYNRMARLPSGFQARMWQIEVVGDLPVEQIVLATTGAELAGVE